MKLLRKSTKGTGGFKLLLAALVVLFVGVPVVWSPKFYFYIDTPKITLIYLVAIFLIAALAFLQLKYRFRVAEAVLLPAVAFFSLAVISSIFAYHRPSAIFGFDGRYEGLLTFVVYFVIFLASAVLASPEPRGEKNGYLQWLIIAALSGGLLVSIVSVANALSGEGVVSFGAGHRDYLGVYLVLILPLAIAGSLSTKKTRSKLGFGAVVLIIILTILVTLSRATWLALGVELMLVLFFLARKWRPRTILIFSLCVLLAIGLLSSLTFTRTAVQKQLSKFSNGLFFIDSAIRGRLEMWKASAKLVRDHPLLGVGPDNFAYAFPKYHSTLFLKLETAQREMSDILVFDPHNQSLYYLVNFGLPAFLALAVIILIVLMKGFLTYRKSGDYILLALVFGCIGFLIADQFNPGRISSSSLFFSFLGLVAGLSGLVTVEPREAPDRRAKLGYIAISALIAGLLMLVMMTNFLGDYYRMNSYTGMDYYDINQCRKAIALLPYREDLDIHLAESGKRLFGLSGSRSNLEYAIGCAEGAVAKNSHNPVAFGYAGLLNLILFDRFGDAEAARKAEGQLKAALALFPNYPRVHRCLGLLYEMEGKKELAEKEETMAFENGYLWVMDRDLGELRD